METSENYTPGHKIVPTELDPTLVKNEKTAYAVSLLKFKEPKVGFFQIVPNAGTQPYRPLSAFLTSDGIKLYDPEKETTSTFQPVYGKDNSLGQVNCMLETIRDKGNNIAGFRILPPDQNLETSGQLATGELPEFQESGYSDVRISFIPEVIIPIGKPLPSESRSKIKTNETPSAKPISITQEEPKPQEDRLVEIKGFTPEQRKACELYGYKVFKLGNFDLATLKENSRFMGLYKKALADINLSAVSKNRNEREVAIRLKRPFILPTGREISPEEQINSALPNQQVTLLNNRTFETVTRATKIPGVKNGTLSKIECIQLEWLIRLIEGGEALLSKQLGHFQGHRMQEINTVNTITGKEVLFTRFLAYNPSTFPKWEEENITTETLVPAVLVPI